MTVVTQHRQIVMARPQGRLHNKIHEATLAIDDELSVAEDRQYREMLVKVAYVLRDFEEGIQKARLVAPLN